MQKWDKHNRLVRQSGSARGVLFIVFVIVGLLWAGAQSLHTALTNRTPAVMSYEAYAKAKPSAKWLVITNCQLNLFRSSYLSYAGDQNPTYYYIPVHDLSSVTGQVCILLKTAEPDLLATIAQIKGLKGDDASLVQWVRKNRARAFPRRNVQGLVCFGIDMKSTDRAELARVQNNIAQDFIILDANAQPSLAAGISYSTAGLASLCGLVVYSRRKIVNG
jgi:hypothetical protein